MIKSFLTLAVILISQISFAQQGSVKAYVSLNPAGDFTGTMKSKGSATMVGSKITAKNIVVDMKSLSTGLDLRDDHAKNKYMEVSKYPEAILIEATGENGKGTGKLKFHGKENPISGTYSIQGGKILQAEFKIKMSQFGISDINYKGIGVEDDVKIEVQIPITATTTPVTATAPGKAAPTSTPPLAPAKPKKK